MGKESGERIEVRLKDGDSIPGYDNKNLFTIKSAQFDK